MLTKIRVLIKMETFLLLTVFTMNAGATDSLKVKSVEQAWDIAQQFTGISAMKNRSQQAMTSATSLIQVEEDKTPFFHEQIKSCQVWEVRIETAITGDQSGITDEKGRKVPAGLTVWINGSTGQFLKAFTKYGEESPDLCPEPSAESSTSQMSRKEPWIGLLDKSPPVSLMDALFFSDKARPHLAKELIAHLVLLNSPEDEPRPVWSIIARGVTGGGPTHGHTIHPCVDNRFRMIVDAVTGELESIYMGFPKLHQEDLK